mgnify:CR=1 FL=1
MAHLRELEEQMFNSVGCQLIRRDKYPVPLNKSHHIFRHRPLSLVVIPFPQNLPVSRDNLSFKAHHRSRAGAKATTDSLLIHQHLADQ